MIMITMINTTTATPLGDDVDPLSFWIVVVPIVMETRCVLR